MSIRLLALAATLALIATTLVGLARLAPAAASPPGRQAVVSAAANYALAHGYRVGVAVLDTQTGDYYGAGEDTGYFASESVVKTMIATKLLATGQMRGNTETLAWKMITQSDNGAADVLYAKTGRSKLMGWIKRYYGLWGLGSPPLHPEHFGNNHITARGMAHFYWHVKNDPKVGPWLMNAMRHATRVSADFSGRDLPLAQAAVVADGDYQWWGIPSATSDWAIKQGWGCEDDAEVGYTCAHADFNTTGFVDGDRYTVAILSRGPVSSYGAKIENMLTHAAQLLMPHGQFPDPPPYVTHLGKTLGRTRGGNTITVHGSNFDRVHGVTFGGKASPKVTVISPDVVKAEVPPAAGGEVNVAVTTDYGTSSNHPKAHYRYVPPPKIATLSATLGAPAGGDTISLTGWNFRHVDSVWFGTTRSPTVTTVSTNELRVVVPAHVAGMVNVAVTTWYGSSPHVLADQYRYVPPPTVHQLAPSSGSGGTAVTVTGSNFRGAGIVVRFGDAPATSVTFDSSTQLTAVAPAHEAGPVILRVLTPFGVTDNAPGDVFTFG